MSVRTRGKIIADTNKELPSQAGKAGKFLKSDGTNATWQNVTASDAGALPTSTKYAKSFTLSINSTTYVLTATLKDQDGNTLGSAQTVDLPLETMVVNGSYDSDTKKIILTLQNGQTIEFSVADLVSGLQTEITNDSKLDADLVDDTTSTHKFVTSTDKSTWSGKQDAITGAATTVTTNNLANARAVITDANGKLAASTTTSTEVGYLSGTTSKIQNQLDGKAASAHTHHGNNITTGTTYYGIISSGGAQYGTVTFDSTVNIVKGDTLFVKWSIAQNTANNLKMNTNGSTSIPLMHKGSQIAANTLNSGDVMEVVYDGTYFQLMSVNKWTEKIPTNVSSFTNDAGYITKSVNDLTNYTPSSSLATVATTGSYSDLSNKPTLGTAAAANTTDFATATQGGKADTAVQPGDLSTVATTGDYGDLLNKPTIPDSIDDLSDTDISTPSGGQVLMFDADTSKWKNTTSTVSIGFDGITGSPEDNAALKNALDAKQGLLGGGTSGTVLTNSGTPGTVSSTTLAAVATSGSYNDLLNKPTIPSISYDGDNARLVIA